MSIYGNPVMLGGSGGGSSTIIPKTITANGVYNASADSADGYDPVTVAIPDGFLPSQRSNSGYVSSGTWYVTNPSSYSNDIFEVQGGEAYLLMSGENTGNRFRAMFTTQNPLTATSNISGTQICNYSTTNRYAILYTAPASGGYVILFTSNQATDVQGYCFSISAKSGRLPNTT